MFGVFSGFAGFAVYILANFGWRVSLFGFWWQSPGCDGHLPEMVRVHSHAAAPPRGRPVARGVGLLELAIRGHPR